MSMMVVVAVVTRCCDTGSGGDHIVALSMEVVGWWSRRRQRW